MMTRKEAHHRKSLWRLRHSILITGSIKRRSSCKGKASVTLPRCGYILIREKHLSSGSAAMARNCTCRLRGSPVILASSLCRTARTLSYEETFAYTVSTTVTTVCGNGTGIYKAGDLSEAQVSPYYCCVDSSENVFVIDHSSSNGDGGERQWHCQD